MLYWINKVNGDWKWETFIWECWYKQANKWNYSWKYLGKLINWKRWIVVIMFEVKGKYLVNVLINYSRSIISIRILNWTLNLTPAIINIIRV